MSPVKQLPAARWNGRPPAARPPTLTASQDTAEQPRGWAGLPLLRLEGHALVSHTSKALPPGASRGADTSSGARQGPAHKSWQEL